MSWLTFGTAVSPEPMSALDTQFTNVASGMTLPCTATGTNAISLVPTSSFPALTSYNELGGYRFVAINNSTAPVTASFNGLTFLNVYHADGVTQASVGDILAGSQYILTFHQPLNGGLGGFYLESPSVGNVVSSAGQFTPGGRLTLQSGVPVMFSNQVGVTNVFYAPYVHPFVPIYNGSAIQMYNFTSALNDQVGLTLALAASASWPINTNFDVYVALNGSTPVLGTVAWTNNTTRATTLSIFGGFLTNSGVITLRTGAATTQSVPANQATFLGTFQTIGTVGTVTWQFGAAASGGTAAILNLCNYYNPVLFVTAVTDNGATYSYTTATVRQARASSGNQINFLQTSSERAITVTSVNTQINNIGPSTAPMGIGVNSTTAFSSKVTSSASGGGSYLSDAVYHFSFTGYGFIAALEQGDGTNANSFNALSTNQLQAKLWL